MDASPGQNDTRRRVFTWRRWEVYVALVAVVGIVVAFIGGPLWLNFKFDREVDRFGTPKGMRLIERHDVKGDFLCVVTCLGKSTEITFTTNTNAPTACVALRRHLRTHGFTLEPPPLGAVVHEDNPCFYWAKAGRIRKNATVTATVLPYGPTTAVVHFAANNG